MTGFWDWFARLVGITTAVLSARVVVVERSASLETRMPQPRESETTNANDTAGPASSKTKEGEFRSSVLGVRVRLVDRLDSAVVEVPAFDDSRIRNLMRSYWRKVHSPLVGPRGSVGRFVAQIGLAPPTAAKANDSSSSDGHWHADPKLWGLDEGTYDQREAVWAPAPARLAWKLNLPAHSVFESAPAAFGADGAVTFEVAVVQSGVRRVLGERTVSKSQRWNEWRIELEGIEGDVQLELKTTSASESPLAAWGSPVVLSPNASQLPYNTVFIVVDAMRGDALASSHEPAEDSAITGAPVPPFDAWLPRMPEVAPNLDKLAARGASFVKAWTAAMWTRPATLAMLTGMRAHRLGMPILELEPRPEHVRSFYESRPPLYALMMRERGAVTRAVVNNMYLCGYVGVGVDTGFEAMTDHRFQTQDTSRITSDTIEWLKSHHNERFALFVNYTSPHAPYVPEREFLDPIEAAAVKPANRQVRRYLAEIRKDDEAIGRVLDEIDRLGLSRTTAIVVTADHGETMSEAHDWVAVDVAKGVPSGRFTHLSTMWDEAARVPIVMALPGRITAGSRITTEVQATDILPTLLDIEGIHAQSSMDGVSLVSLLEGKASEARPVVIEGRGAQSIRAGEWRLVVRSPVARRLRKGDSEFEKAVELYNLKQDPGERHDVSATNGEVVDRLRKELERILANHRTETPTQAKAEGSAGAIRLRFSSGGRSARIRGTVHLKGEGSLKIMPEDSAATVVPTGPGRYEINLQSAPDQISVLKLLVEPADVDVAWQWWLDDTPWPKNATFGGPLGVSIPELAAGVDSSMDGALAVMEQPFVDPKREVGLFVSRELRLDAGAELSQSAQLEAQQAMQAWGYVRKPDAAKQKATTPRP